MAKLTRKMIDEIADMRASTELPSKLRAYIRISTDALIYQVNREPQLYSRRELQGHIDTLTDLINAKVYQR